MGWPCETARLIILRTKGVSGRIVGNNLPAALNALLKLTPHIVRGRLGNRASAKQDAYAQVAQS
jgi:hypothetical protein